MSDVWGINRGVGMRQPADRLPGQARPYGNLLAQMATDESSSPPITSPPIARHGVVMMTIGCQTVLAWVESPVQRFAAGPVGIHLQGNSGDTLLSIANMEKLLGALSSLIEEAKLKEREIRSKLAEEDAP